MKAGGVPEKLMISYLLGELSEEEQLTFEKAWIDDDNLFEEILAIEAELTDDYVRGGLVGTRRAAFERRLLNSSDSAMRLRLAKLITENHSPQAALSARPLQAGTSDKWWSFAWLSAPNRLVPAGTAALLIIGISLGLLVWKKQASQTSATVTPALPPATNPAIVSPPSAVSPNPSKSNFVVATFVITGGGERDSGNVNELKISPEADRVQLRVSLAGSQYAGYRASLQAIDSRATVNLPDVKASPAGTGQVLSIQFPANDLPPGDWMLTVTGVPKDDAPREVVGKYFIRRLP